MRGEVVTFRDHPVRGKKGKKKTKRGKRGWWRSGPIKRRKKSSVVSEKPEKNVIKREKEE